MVRCWEEGGRKEFSYDEAIASLHAGHGGTRTPSIGEEYSPIAERILVQKKLGLHLLPYRLMLQLIVIVSEGDAQDEGLER
jgi:hypothetical protein